MIHNLIRLIAPVFLIKALSLHAQTTTQSTAFEAPSPSSPPPTMSCNALSGRTPGVQSRLNQYKSHVRGRQCIVLSADRTVDTDQLINQIPENTVILLSSNTAPAVKTPSPSGYPVSGKVPVEYLIGGEIRLKNGQDILGAADDGHEIVIRDRPGFVDKHFVKVGTTDNFQFDETKDSHIRHLSFQPSRENGSPAIDSIVFAECYNRKLILKDNVFHLPLQASLVLDCNKSLDASDNVNRQGPGLLFAENTVIGTSFKKLNKTLVPEKGISINLPAIRNQQEALTVSGNRIRGKMAEAGEFKLGSGSGINIFKNTVDISNYGSIGRPAFLKGGFALLGHANSGAKTPLFNVVGNKIRVTATAITIGGLIELSMSCNHLQAFNAWWQFQPQYNLKALPATFGDIGRQCENVVSFNDVIPTPRENIRAANTWTATHYSSDTACSGLVNFEGQLFFDTGNCQSFAPSFISSTRTTDSTTTTESICMNYRRLPDHTVKFFGLCFLMTLMGLFCVM
ncbi:hypothetical protein [Endozoicomonas sp. 8E]|uniref:hypothetical protein n=1 Tax=Endozoicomonas sp. 8E TaxID=3035692 RepID=UPI0029394ABF|nr:hypothetical protein [Endozoicomonas sp. 8E]WOG30075.1 hypothetical protein P6910_10590 [Endozoicomonas sp. 8E]